MTQAGVSSIGRERTGSFEADRAGKQTFDGRRQSSASDPCQSYNGSSDDHVNGCWLLHNRAALGQLGYRTRIMLTPKSDEAFRSPSAARGERQTLEYMG